MPFGKILAAGISQSHRPFNNRAVNGSKLSTRLAHNFDPTAIAKEKVCRGKYVALRYSRRSRRIVIISFSSENGVRFDASCLPLGVEKYSNGMYPVLSHRVSKFSFEGFQLALKIKTEQWLLPRLTKQNKQPRD